MAFPKLFLLNTIGWFLCRDRERWGKFAANCLYALCCCNFMENSSSLDNFGMMNFFLSYFLQGKGSRNWIKLISLATMKQFHFLVIRSWKHWKQFCELVRAKCLLCSFRSFSFLSLAFAWFTTHFPSEGWPSKFHYSQPKNSSQPLLNADKACSDERKGKNAETLIDEINLCGISRMSIDFLVSN